MSRPSRMTRPLVIDCLTPVLPTEPRGLYKFTFQMKLIITFEHLQFSQTRKPLFVEQRCVLPEKTPVGFIVYGTLTFLAYLMIYLKCSQLSPIITTH